MLLYSLTRPLQRTLLETYNVDIDKTETEPILYFLVKLSVQLLSYIHRALVVVIITTERRGLKKREKSSRCCYANEETRGSAKEQNQREKVARKEKKNKKFVELGWLDGCCGVGMRIEVFAHFQWVACGDIDLFAHETRSTKLFQLRLFGAHLCVGASWNVGKSREKCRKNFPSNHIIFSSLDAVALYSRSRLRNVDSRFVEKGRKAPFFCFEHSSERIVR